MSLFKSFLRNESGATAIEYGLIAAGISVAIIAVVNGLGTKLNGSFSSLSGQLKEEASDAWLRRGSGRHRGLFALLRRRRVPSADRLALGGGNARTTPTMSW